MTWEIRITRQIKDDDVVIDRKDEFEYVSQTILANTTATASSGYQNSLAFYCL